MVDRNFGNGNDGSDILVNIENLRFNDVVFDLSGNTVPLRLQNGDELLNTFVSLHDSTGATLTVAGSALTQTNSQIELAEVNFQTTGAVDVKDALAQIRHINGVETLSGFGKTAADNDGNGAIETNDLMASLRQIVGLDPAPAARLVDGNNNQFFFGDSVTELFVIAPGDVDLSWTPTDLV